MKMEKADQPTAPDDVGSSPPDDSAKARMDRYAKDRQGLKDWTVDAIVAHATAIALALEFEETGDESALPSDLPLAAELERAATKFEKSKAAVWRVLKKYYRESDVALNAWAEKFVADYAADLKEANDQRQLGDIDDDEPNDAPDTDPKSFAARAKEAATAAADELRRKEEEILRAIQRAIRNRPDIGAASAEPPGASEGMETHGRWRSTKYGLFAPGDGVWPWNRICKTRLKPLAHSATDTNTDPRVHLIQTTYEGERQHEREIEIPRWKITSKSTGAAIKALTHFNTYVVRNDFARSEMVNFLNLSTKLKITRTKTTGWHKIDGAYCFVLPLAPPELAPIMPTKKRQQLVRRKSKSKAGPEIWARLDTPIEDTVKRYGFSVSGKVEEWQREIARPLEGCSNVALAAGVAFAGPLVFFAAEQLGGFHIWGTSTWGKSAAGAVGESIYGRPSNTFGRGEPFGAKWATASDKGIVALAAKRTDCGLFLDELGSAKSAKDKLVQAIYILSGGTPPLRADSRGNLREQTSFRMMLFSTGEFPLATFLDKLDDTEGRRKRLVDVPAQVGPETALETVPHERLGELCGQIYAVTARLHGAVGQEWLRHLVELGEARIMAKLEQHRKAWLALPEIAELLHRDPQKDSVIRRFALVAAALRMAAKAGFWSWSIESSDRGIVGCTLRWAEGLGMPVVTLETRAAEQKLRERIAAARQADRFIKLVKHPGKGGGLFVPAPEHMIRFSDRAAFKSAGSLFGFIKIDGPDQRVLIYRDEFHRLTEGCGIDRDALIAHLKRTGALTIKNEKIRAETKTYAVLTEAFVRIETKSG